MFDSRCQINLFDSIVCRVLRLSNLSRILWKFNNFLQWQSNDIFRPRNFELPDSVFGNKEWKIAFSPASPSSPPSPTPLKRKILPLRWEMSSLGCRAVQVYFRQVGFSNKVGAILPSLESRLLFYLWKRHSFITFLTHIHRLKALLFLKYAKRLWNRSILKISGRFVLLYLMFHPVSPDLLTTA